MATIQPLQGYVIIKPVEGSDKTQSGIILAEKTEERGKGTVVAIPDTHMSPLGKDIPVPVKVGDNVLFAAHGGDPVMIGEEELIILGIPMLKAIVT